MLLDAMALKIHELALHVPINVLLQLLFVWNLTGHGWVVVNEPVENKEFNWENNSVKNPNQSA